MNAQEMLNEGLYDSVEDALSHAIIKKLPPEEQMRRIRFRYPSSAFFIESNEYMLRQAGLGNADAFYFWMIPGLARCVAQESFGEKPRLNTLSRMAAYLKSLYLGVHVEYFYAVLLDARGILIKTVLVGRGTVNAAPFDMGKMLSTLVEHNAKAVVLCHNHPGGTLKPSPEDIQCTLRALAATATISVPLLDHIIIAGESAVSLRESGCIQPGLWVMMQGPRKKLVREWVDMELLN
ncbi:MAG: JAB domain-containing protein [Clostridia bacterium]|nr:JAB domain-containing protein [Clostridia bacterium]